MSKKKHIKIDFKALETRDINLQNHLFATFYRYVTDQWGPECLDFEPGCGTCAMWAKYHDLRAVILELAPICEEV